MLGLNLPALEKEKKYTADDRFLGNGPYGEILTQKELIRTLGLTLAYNKYVLLDISLCSISEYFNELCPILASW